MSSARGRARFVAQAGDPTATGFSGGAFDPTYGSQPGARGYGLLNLNADRRSVGLRKGARLNFGAIAKGYALDAAARILRDAGVRSALLNFGGQVLVVGEPPKGESWPVRIGETGPTLRLRSGSVSTSGLSERPAHILNPKSGRAVKGQSGVTVIAPTATEADAWSTALFVSGLDAFRPAFPGCAISYDPDKKEVLRTAGDCSEYLDGNAR